MVSVLAMSAIDRGLNPRSDQTIDYDIGIRCFFDYHVSLRNKIKDWLAWNPKNVSYMRDMSFVDLFQWASSIEIQLSMLVLYKVVIILVHVLPDLDGGVGDTTLYDKICLWLAAGWMLTLSNIFLHRCDIAEILLNVTLNTIATLHMLLWTITYA
jgi:hypothetical protein